MSASSAPLLEVVGPYTPPSPPAADNPVLRACAALHSASAVAAHRLEAARSDRGQSTAEYALVILGAAAVAGLLLAWAGQTNRIGRLLDVVLDKLINQFR